MIYFKFPFDEQLYSTDSASESEAVRFQSFDQNISVEFEGEIIGNDILKINSGEFYNDLKQLNEDFQAEKKSEYLHKLETLIQIIKEENLPKVVLSRRKIVENCAVDPKKSFENLCNAYPNAFRYIFSKEGVAWMGAFSELLGRYNKETRVFETMSLAGTLPVEESWTSKEIEEQKPVSNYITNILEQYSKSVEISSTYDHISGNIKHLRTDFKAEIKREELDKIISDLHPTPAVCGMPKEICKSIIADLEKFPRELYAGYIKVETKAEIHYYVNLRSARIYPNSVHAFVGGGITAQSDPEKEWQETELKSQAILKNLVSKEKGV